MFINFTEHELLRIINDSIEESLHLDYKSSGSLIKNDNKKRELAKDVSSFANSDGGHIIYGIKEFDSLNNKHLPEKIDPIDRRVISKEWLEQVIVSNIFPKIQGLMIYPISLTSGINDVVYVVQIPKSNTAHQASDRRYYKRYNFESVAMEDYEIKDIINRSFYPDLEFVKDQSLISYDVDVLKVPIVMKNNSLRLAKDISVSVSFKDHENYRVAADSGFIDVSQINSGKIYLNITELKIYNGINCYAGAFTIKFNSDIKMLNFTATIYGDNMSPIEQDFKIHIDNNIPKYVERKLSFHVW
ncbi:MAG: ATP-binding protein [Flavobacterium sp.]|jgi:hypothetical protein|nr:ATP-binding protein [Flavobacterium sp.]